METACGAAARGFRSTRGQPRGSRGGGGGGGLGTSLDFGTVLSSDSIEAPGPAGAGEGRQLPGGASFPGLGPDPGWRARLGAQEGERGLRAPAERLAWVREPFHRWPRRCDGGISQRKMWGAGERGCLHFLAAALGPRSRDSRCPGLGWFPPAAHTLVPCTQ